MSSNDESDEMIGNLSYSCGCTTDLMTALPRTVPVPRIGDDDGFDNRSCCRTYRRRCLRRTISSVSWVTFAVAVVVGSVAFVVAVCFCIVSIFDEWDEFVVSGGGGIEGSRTDPVCLMVDGVVSIPGASIVVAVILISSPLNWILSINSVVPVAVVVAPTGFASEGTASDDVDDDIDGDIDDRCCCWCCC